MRNERVVCYYYDGDGDTILCIIGYYCGHKVSTTV